MSFKDTIDGAVKEATDGGFTMPGAKGGRDARDAKGEAPEEEAEQTKRRARGSAASARPTRERAGSVRVQSSSPTGGKSRALASKEEKKAMRQKERDKEDLLTAATNVLQKSDPEYQRSERLFWTLMIIGFTCTVISLVLNYVVLPSGAGGAYQGIISIVTLVVAYVFIIGGFGYDLAKRNPMRKAFTQKASSMSDAKKRALLEDDYARREAKKGARRGDKKAEKPER